MGNELENEIFNKVSPSSIIFTEWISKAWLREIANQQVPERSPVFIDNVSDKTMSELWQIFAGRYMNYNRMRRHGK